MSQRESELRDAATAAKSRISQLLTDAQGNPPHPSHLDYILIQIALFGAECAPRASTAEATCKAIVAEVDRALALRADQASASVVRLA